MKDAQAPQAPQDQQAQPGSPGSHGSPGSQPAHPLFPQVSRLSQLPQVGPAALFWTAGVSLVAVVAASLFVQRTRERIDKLDQRIATLEQRTATLEKAEVEARRARTAAPAKPASGPDPAVVWAIPLEDAPSRGGAAPWVTIVEFGEYQCPYCARAHAALATALAPFGDSVRLVWRHLPLTKLHDRALPAAHAAECAREQGRFWTLHEALLTGEPTSRDLSDGAIRDRMARLPGAGIDLTEWQTCVTEKRHEARIKRDQDLARQFGVQGTPSFFINGRYLGGAQSAETFRARIEEALAKARDSGISAETYYDTAVMTRGRTGR